MLADGNFSIFSFFFTHNQHVRNTLQFVIANLTSYLLVTLIHNCTNIVLFQELLHFLCVVIEFFADGQNSHLFRSQPQWEFTSRMLNKHSNKTLHRAKRRTVYHYRTMFLIISACIFQFKTLRQVIVHLNGTQLPTAADSIFHHKIQLRTIESSFTIFNSGTQALFFTSLNDRLFSSFPVFIATNIFFTIHFVTQGNLSLHIGKVHGTEYD